MTLANELAGEEGKSVLAYSASSFAAANKFSTAKDLATIKLIAKKDLTLSDLGVTIEAQNAQSGETVYGQTDCQTSVMDQLADNILLNYIVCPTLSASVKDDATIYTSSTAAEIASLIDVTYINAAGVSSPVDADDVTVTLPEGGLKADTNILTATANGVSCTFVANCWRIP